MAYIEEVMTEEEKVLFEELKAVMTDDDNKSRNYAGLKYNFEYADCVVLLGQIRHSCLGCYPGDVNYIEKCHHDALDVCPCSLWKYRGGIIHTANTRKDEKARKRENQTNADRKKLVRAERIKGLKETLKRKDLPAEYRNKLVRDLEKLENEGQ